MAKYLLSIYQPDGTPPPAEALDKVMEKVGALLQEMKSEGAWVFNSALHPPSTATVVRFKAGDSLITDGPYAEGKEHLGGFLIAQAADLDGALRWAKKLARALTLEGHEAQGGLPVEVRPIAEH
jgi:hypothetical protein